MVDQPALPAAVGPGAGRRDQLRLPRRARRPPTRRQAEPAPGTLARTRVRDAVSQGTQLRLPADRRRRRARVPAAGADRPRPDRARSTVDRPLPADPHPVRTSRSSPAGSTGATRTSWCARSAGGCRRAGCGRRSTGQRCAPRERTQNRSLFWLEAVVAADTMQACKTVAAAVQSRRGENRLHRRWMVVRAGPLPPPVPARARTAAPVDAQSGVRRRGRAPARAADRPHEGRAGPAPDAAPDPRSAGRDARHPPDGRASTTPTVRRDHPARRAA